MARLPYLEKSDLPEDDRDILSRDINLYKILAHSPNAARAFQVNRTLVGASTAYSASPLGSIAGFIRYVGTNDLAAVAVAAAGDFTFTADDVDGLTTASTPTLPTSGTAGTIDVSNAEGDTWGELYDGVNLQSEWEMVLSDVLPGQSTNNTAATLTAANSQTGSGAGLNGVQSSQGVAILLDMDLTDTLYGSSTWSEQFSIGFEHDEKRGFDRGNKLSDPIIGNTKYRRKVNRLTSARAALTAAAGVAGDFKLEVYAVDDKAKTSQLVFGGLSTAVATTVMSADMLPNNDFVETQVGERMVGAWTNTRAQTTALSAFMSGTSTYRGYNK